MSSNSPSTSVAERGTSSAASALMPEPGEQTRTAKPGSAAAADDLIAKLADKQIDSLIDEADLRPTPRDANADAAMELAMQAAEELSKIANDLGRATDQLVHADLEPDADEVPPELEKPTEQPADAVAKEAEPASTLSTQPGFDPAADLGAELAADAAAKQEATADAERTAPLSEAVPTEAAATADVPDVEATKVEAGEKPAAEVATEPVIDEAPPAPPSFNPPAHAEVTRDPSSLNDGEQPTEQPVAPLTTTADDLESSAEAVARELAEDVRPPSPTGEPEPAPRPLPSGVWWRVALRRVSEVPALCLQVVNLPAAAMTDTGREVMGAIAIVTLVNAMSLLLYLMVFG